MTTRKISLSQKTKQKANRKHTKHFYKKHQSRFCIILKLQKRDYNIFLKKSRTP